MQEGAAEQVEAKPQRIREDHLEAKVQTPMQGAGPVEASENENACQKKDSVPVTAKADVQANVDEESARKKTEVDDSSKCFAGPRTMTLTTVEEMKQAVREEVDSVKADTQVRVEPYVLPHFLHVIMTAGGRFGC
jgi:hypothetical protein